MLKVRTFRDRGVVDIGVAKRLPRDGVTTNTNRSDLAEALKCGKQDRLGHFRGEVCKHSHTRTRIPVYDKRLER